MDESWYVTPPACFTQAGPVHVETSPLEDLLIEHPSMSVYRSAGSPGPEGYQKPPKKSNQRQPLARRSEPGNAGKAPGPGRAQPHQQQDRDRRPASVRDLQELPRRSSIRELRTARGDENLRIVQIRSAQKVSSPRLGPRNVQALVRQGRSPDPDSAVAPERS